MKSEKATDKIEIGAFGEAAAEKHYLSTGFHTLDKNFKHRGGEIDLILKKNDLIVFAEVKARSNFEEIHPSEAVIRGKRSKIINAAKYYIYKKEYAETDYYFRFDIVNIYIYSYPDKYKIEVFENAFDERGKII